MLWTSETFKLSIDHNSHTAAQRLALFHTETKKRRYKETSFNRYIPLGKMQPSFGPSRMGEALHDDSNNSYDEVHYVIQSRRKLHRSQLGAARPVGFDLFVEKLLNILV